METTPRPLTLGESRVRTSFNPSQDEAVRIIKERTAEIIDIVSSLPHPDSSGNELIHGEFSRCKAVSMTEFESACMWAVKAATFGK